MKETFSKEERLYHQKLIQELYSNGLSLSATPLKARWLFVPDPMAFPAQVMIAVPKARFNEASARNLIRRRIRESYRKNKHLLYDSLAATGKHMIIVITYNGKKILPYSEIEEKIILLLQRLIKENEKASG